MPPKRRVRFVNSAQSVPDPVHVVPNLVHVEKNLVQAIPNPDDSSQLDILAMVGTTHLLEDPVLSKLIVTRSYTIHDPCGDGSHADAAPMMQQSFKKWLEMTHGMYDTATSAMRHFVESPAVAVPPMRHFVESPAVVVPPKRPHAESPTVAVPPKRPHAESSVIVVPAKRPCVESQDVVIPPKRPHMESPATAVPAKRPHVESLDVAVTVLPQKSNFDVLCDLGIQLPRFGKLLILKMKDGSIIMRVLAEKLNGRKLDAVIRIENGNFKECFVETKNNELKLFVTWLQKHSNPSLEDQLKMIAHDAPTFDVTIKPATSGDGYIGIHRYHGVGGIVCFTSASKMSKISFQQSQYPSLDVANPTLAIVKTPNSPFDGVLKTIKKVVGGFEIDGNVMPTKKVLLLDKAIAASTF
jgi:hypothetical protein